MKGKQGLTGPPGSRDAYLVGDRTTFRRGGVGVVYQAIARVDRGGLPAGTPVGLKMLTGMDDSRFGKLAERSLALASLRHPSLARHIECFVGPPPAATPLPEEEADQFFSVHAWVSGVTLEEAAAEASVDDILSWLDQIASALDYLHSSDRELAHRDVTPRNVIVDLADDRATLIDFDTVLWGEVGDTRLVNVSGASSSSRDGLAGAQADDRSMLAGTALIALSGLRAASASEGTTAQAAAARLIGAAADPDHVVNVLRTLQAEPPDSARSVMERVRSSLRQRPSGRRKQLVLLGVIATAVAAVAAMSWVLKQPGGPPDARTPTGNSSSASPNGGVPEIPMSALAYPEPDVDAVTIANAAFRLDRGNELSAALPSAFRDARVFVGQPTTVRSQFTAPASSGAVRCLAQFLTLNDELRSYAELPVVHVLGLPMVQGPNPFAVSVVTLPSNTEARALMDNLANSITCAGAGSRTDPAPNTLLPNGAAIVTGTRSAYGYTFVRGSLFEVAFGPTATVGQLPTPIEMRQLLEGLIAESRPIATEQPVLITDDFGPAPPLPKPLRLAVIFDITPVKSRPGKDEPGRPIKRGEPVNLACKEFRRGSLPLEDFWFYRIDGGVNDGLRLPAAAFSIPGAAVARTLPLCGS